MNHHNNSTGFWIVDIFMFIGSILLFMVGYFIELVAPQLSIIIKNLVHTVAPQLNIVLAMEQFDEWLKRIVLITSGFGAIAAMIFGYLNYKLNKKKKG